MIRAVHLQLSTVYTELEVGNVYSGGKASRSLKSRSSPLPEPVVEPDAIGHAHSPSMHGGGQYVYLAQVFSSVMGLRPESLESVVEGRTAFRCHSFTVHHSILWQSDSAMNFSSALHSVILSLI